MFCKIQTYAKAHESSVYYYRPSTRALLVLSEVSGLSVSSSNSCTGSNIVSCHCTVDSMCVVQLKTYFNKSDNSFIII